MIAIPATAILLTNLDFWEKIRAVCKIVAEQRIVLHSLGPEIPLHYYYLPSFCLGQL